MKTIRTYLSALFMLLLLNACNHSAKKNNIATDSLQKVEKQITDTSSIFYNLNEMLKHYAFIDENMFKSQGITEITDTITTQLQQKFSTSYYLKDGKLTKRVEKTFLNDTLSKIETYSYFYKKDKNKNYVLSHYDLKSDDLNEFFSTQYTYTAGKLFAETVQKGYRTNQIKYFYNSGGAINYQRHTDSISPHESDVDYTYYLYYKNEVIGYFGKSYSITTDPFEYELKSLTKKEFLKEIMESYKKSNGKNEIDISSENFLFNKKPMKDFLKKLGKSDAQYIVLKFNDNTMIFYNLVN